MSKPRWNSDITPYPFQHAGVGFFNLNPYSMNADEAGAGKTLMALKSVLDRQLTPTIICPGYLAANWRREIAKYCIGDTSKYRIQTYSQTAPFDTRGTDCLIIDESAYIKSPDAQRTQKVAALVRDGGFDAVHLLNASPIKNRVPDLYPQLWIISKSFREMFPTYTSFAGTFCDEKRGYQGHTKYVGVKNLDQLKTLLKPLMIRRMIADLVGLPDKTNKKVVVSYGEDVELQREWEKHIVGKAGRDSTAKLRSAIAKAPFTAEYVYDLVVSGSHPIVVFSDHPDALDIIYGKLTERRLRCRVVGAIDPSLRQQYVDEMQNGEIEVLLCSIPAFSTGWNGTAARHMVFNDICWGPEDLYQASRRILRIGQKFCVFYHFIVGSKVDDAIINNVTGKQETIHKVLN